LRRAYFTFALLATTAIGLWAEDTARPGLWSRQGPDPDGVYYVGPDVTSPRLVTTVFVSYPYASSEKHFKGMTVLAMVINAKGVAEHIQILHHSNDIFDQLAVDAVEHSTFAPGMLAGKPVPVWIDVRVVFSSDQSRTTPQVLIAERDLAPPTEFQLEDKNHKPRSYTPPFPIHTVDADFADPFVKVPYIQVAVVSVLVSKEGLPTDVRVVRGLGFGLDQKAAAAVWHYRFFPAMRKGKPSAARRDVMVNFVKF